MRARHEIPTLLGAPAEAAFGLTARQLLAASLGLALAYGAWAESPLPPALGLAAAAAVLAATAAGVLARPLGRGLEEWAFVLARYYGSQRPGPARARPAARRAVVLPAPGSPEGGGDRAAPG